MKNKIEEVLEKQISLIKPSEKELEKIAKETKIFIKELQAGIKKNKLKADVFIGGSLAKETMIKKDKYDIDIFIRFDKSYKDNGLSKLLEKILKNARKIHGSRDYFQIKKGRLIFEIIPTIRITKPEQARNVTDLSYFHVNYIQNKIKKNKGLANEIRLAKSFCFFQDCYGAESFIGGFSGYALELLVSHYRSFFNFAKSVQGKEKIILDPAKFYKNKNEILLELNEAKLSSPIIFVDPTFKERNALAALSLKTFEKFQKSSSDFLTKPSNKFFEKQDLETKIKKKYKNLIIIQARTNRQKGDIAGSKLKKFSEFLLEKLERHFEIKFKDFFYDDKKNIGKIYLSVKPRKKLILPGPPATSVEHLARFKKAHKTCFIKQGKAYAYEKAISFKKFLQDLKKDKILKEMGITKIDSVKQA